MNSLSQAKTPPTEAAPETTPAPVVSAPPASVTVANADKKVLVEKRQPVPAVPQSTQPSLASVNRAETQIATDLPKERDRAQESVQQKQVTVATSAAAAPPTNLEPAFKTETAADSTAAGALAKDAQHTLATTPVPQSNNLAFNSYAFERDQQTSQARPTLQRPTADPAATSTALFDSAKATGNATTRSASQVFYRLQVPAARRSATPILGSAAAAGAAAPVLTSFRVEQSGNDMKVFDADGSVYTGSVQIAQQEPPATRSVAPKNQPTQISRAAAPAPQTYFFRVVGTNRQLNENVVFSGDFVPWTNYQPAANYQSTAGVRGGFGGVARVNVGGGGGGRIIEPAAGEPVQAILPNSQINGNVVIGDQKAIDIIATPAPTR
jgi:hypothetical protein